MPPQLSSSPLGNRKEIIMSIVFSLQDVADSLEMFPGSGEQYLDFDTGEVVYVSEDDQMCLEYDDEEGIPDWQKEHIKVIRRIFAAECIVALPSKYEINSWSIMESFCHSLPDDEQSAQLLAVVHGKGAFGRFKAVATSLGLLEGWYKFKSSSYEQMAREWLEGEGIQFK